ncbi:MAG: type II secretion system F family protein [Planctomycetota bacterium]
MATKIQRKVPVRRPSGPSAAGGEGGSSGGGGLSFLGRRRVSPKLLTQFTVQLSVLQDAGLPIVRCLKILGGQMRPGVFRNIVDQIVEDVEGGNSLSESMAKHPSVFDRLYVNMIRAGEAGGVLNTILDRLADFAEKAERIKGKVKSALIYPIVVSLVAAVVLSLIMIIVVPKFQEIFESFNTDMPAVTQALIDVSDAFVNYWYLIFGVPFLVFALFRLSLRSPKVRFAYDRFMLKVPIFGDINSRTIVARFSRTFGTLISSGVPHLEGLNIVKGSIDNAVLERSVDKIYESIREGESMAKPMGESGLFDDLVVNMVDVGEETGELDKMLMKVADNYEEIVENKVNNLFKVLEPIILVGLAVVVGFIIFALFMPMMSLLEQIG